MPPLLLDATDRLLLNHLQMGMPICAAPYAAVAAELNLSESEVVQRLQRLLAIGALSRFGPLFHIEKMGGEFVLAALAVPTERFAEVTEQVNALPQVAHNYARQHTLNMWFVLACETPAETAATIAEIEAITGLSVYAFPKEREYFVGMHLHV